MRPTTLLRSLTILAATSSVAFAQSPSVPPTAPSLNSPASGMTTTTTASSPTKPAASSMAPSADDMKQMMEMAKLNENHKLLASTAATKSFTYTGEYEMMPGMKEKVRQVIKMPDNNHMTMEYYEDRGQGEAKTMQIDYTRKK